MQLGFAIDRIRVIDSRLAAMDRIIVKKLQRVQQAIKVTPKTMDAKQEDAKPAESKKS